MLYAAVISEYKWHLCIPSFELAAEVDITRPLFPCLQLLFSCLQCKVASLGQCMISFVLDRSVILRHMHAGYGVYRLIHVSTARDRKQKDKKKQKEAKKKK